MDKTTQVSQNEAAGCGNDKSDHEMIMRITGPNNKVARAAPEIDIIEAQIQKDDNGRHHSYASQSIQTAPFDIEYFL